MLDYLGVLYTGHSSHCLFYLVYIAHAFVLRTILCLTNSDWRKCLRALRSNTTATFINLTEAMNIGECSLLPSFFADITFGVDSSCSVADSFFFAFRFVCEICSRRISLRRSWRCAFVGQDISSGVPQASDEAYRYLSMWHQLELDRHPCMSHTLLCSVLVCPHQRWRQG